MSQMYRTILCNPVESRYWVRYPSVTGAPDCFEPARPVLAHLWLLLLEILRSSSQNPQKQSR